MTTKMPRRTPMPLRVFIPATYEPERRYIVSTLFNAFLGAPAPPIEVDASIERIRICSNDDQQYVQVCDGFFRVSPSAWLTQGSLKAATVAWKDTAELGDLPFAKRYGTLPCIFSSHPPERLLEPLEHGSLQVNVDIFGASFFLLTRYEELVTDELDRHGRPLARTSLASRHGFLRRALVNEYADLLAQAIFRTWPWFQRSRRAFSVFSTHDVDSAFAFVGGRARFAARMAMQDFRQNEVGSAMSRPLQWSRVRFGQLEHDPWNTFDLMMNESESAGAQCAFFFIPDPDPTGRSAEHTYRLTDPPVQHLLRRISDRGHEIGIHPSYQCGAEPERLVAELKTLVDACERAGVQQDEFGGRHHFLRWSPRHSFRAWDDLGLVYDSSLAYAEEIGFRASACVPYPTYDLLGRRPLELQERPLVLMDTTLYSRTYLDLPTGGAEASRYVEELADTCRMHGGEFVMLFHNSQLSGTARRAAFRKALTPGVPAPSVPSEASTGTSAR